MLTAYKKFWKQYADFSGRSSRSDFWWVFLINFIIVAVPAFIATMILFASGAYAIFGVLNSDYPYSSASAIGGGAILAFLIYIPVVIYWLATLVPNIALGVRRLRDAGYHWAFIFLDYGTMILFFIPGISLLSWPCRIAYWVLAAMPTKEVGSYNGGYNQYNQAGFQGQQFGQNQQNFQGQQFNQGQQPVQNQQFGGQGQQNFQGQPFGQNQQNFQAQQQNAQQPFGGQPQQPVQNQTFGQEQGAVPTQPFGQNQQTEQANTFNQAQQPFGQAQETQQPFDSQQPQQAAQPEQAAQNTFAAENQPASQDQSVFGQQFDIAGTQEQAIPQTGPIQSEPISSEELQVHSAENPFQTNEEAAPASEETQENSSETKE